MFPGRDSGEYRRRTGAVVAPHLLGALLRQSTKAPHHRCKPNAVHSSAIRGFISLGRACQP